MSRFWILAADHAGARVFATDKRAGPIEEIDAMEHPEARMKENEFEDKEVGAGSPSMGHARDTKGDEHPHKRGEEERFAREIAEYLDKACEKKQFLELYILSEPRFLGALRSALPDKVQKMLKDEIPKEVTRQPPEKIRKQLPEWL